MPEPTTAERGNTVALAILGAAMAAAVVALLYWGRDQVMIGDDLFYAQRLAENSLGHAILHSNLYLLAVPMVLYQAMFELFGLGSYLPYRLVAIALALVCAGLFYALARRRIGPLQALAPTILILFFGSGGEELLTGERIPSLLAIATGLGAILSLEREERRGDVGAAVLLSVSATSHPTGIGFLAAAAIMIALRPSPRRWRSAWVVAIPAVLVAVFLIFYQRTADTPHQGISDVLSFERASWTMLTAAVSGLSGVLRSPVWDRPLAEIASAVAPGPDRRRRGAAMAAPATDLLGGRRRTGRSGRGDAALPGRVRPGARRASLPVSGGDPVPVAPGRAGGRLARCRDPKGPHRGRRLGDRRPGARAMGQRRQARGRGVEPARGLGPGPAASTAPTTSSAIA